VTITTRFSPAKSLAAYGRPRTIPAASRGASATVKASGSAWPSNPPPRFASHNRLSTRLEKQPPWRPGVGTIPACCQEPYRWWRPWWPWCWLIISCGNRGSAASGDQDRRQLSRSRSLDRASHDSALSRLPPRATASTPPSNQGSTSATVNPPAAMQAGSFPRGLLRRFQ
jgi:hypothetical protein